MTKKEIAVELGSLGFYEIEGDIDNLIQKLEETKEYYSKLPGVTKLSVEKRDYPYNGGEYIAVLGHRLENDEEYNKRLEQEKKYQEQQDIRDKQEFDRLSKKFKD